MSLKETIELKEVSVEVAHCDGPSHEGSTALDFSNPKAFVAVTVHHGYGSHLDGDRQDFCSFKCLRDWVAHEKSLHKETLDI